MAEQNVSKPEEQKPAEEKKEFDIKEVDSKIGDVAGGACNGCVGCQYPGCSDCN